nr:squalene/phytoene synthase family protein [Polymorphobacter fuscus]
MAEVRQRDRDRYLSILYAPEPVRPALFALHGLDLEMAHVVAGTTDPMIGAIRLAWWREALEGLDDGVVPAQPLLQLTASAVLPRGIGGKALATIEDRWLEMIDSAAVPAAHVAGGAALFGWAATLLGGDPALGARLGTAWTLGDDSALPRVPALLRPLLGLARLSARDAARARAGKPAEMRGSLARQWLLLKAIALGL